MNHIARAFTTNDWWISYSNQNRRTQSWVMTTKIHTNPCCNILRLWTCARGLKSKIMKTLEIIVIEFSQMECASSNIFGPKKVYIFAAGLSKNQRSYLSGFVCTKKNERNHILDEKHESISQELNQTVNTDEFRDTNKTVKGYYSNCTTAYISSL